MKAFSAYRLLLVASLTSLVAGCGSKPAGPTLYPVRGQLFINGKPAEGALVRFHPATGDRADGDVYPVGVAGPDGSFQVKTREPGDGAAAGEYRLTVRWQKGSGPLAPDLLGGRFRNPNHPVRTVKIIEGENVLDPIHLEARLSDRPVNRDDQPAGRGK